MLESTRESIASSRSRSGSRRSVRAHATHGRNAANRSLCGSRKKRRTRYQFLNRSSPTAMTVPPGRGALSATEAFVDGDAVEPDVGSQRSRAISRDGLRNDTNDRVDIACLLRRAPTREVVSPYRWIGLLLSAGEFS